MVDEKELRKRVAAASSYAGLSDDALATKIGMSRSTFNRRLTELSNARRRDPFLTLVADKCGLEYEFFTADFARLGEVADDDPPEEELDEVGELRQQVAELTGLVKSLTSKLEAVDLEQLARDVSRSVTQGAADLLGVGVPNAPADTDTHDAGDANPEPGQAQTGGTP